MKITYDQTFKEPLAEFGADVVRMIKCSDYARIADQYGYALAYDRPLADAIAADVDTCLNSDGRSASVAKDKEPRISVSYFKQPDSVALFGLVKCLLPLDQGEGQLLVELIVSTNDTEFHLWLEDVSYAV